MSITSFEVIKREPVCQYCAEVPAAWWVVTLVGLEEQRYAACSHCRDAVENGLHECDYNCEADHVYLWQMPPDPRSKEWLKERLRQDRERVWKWIDARCPELREENGVIVW